MWLPVAPASSFVLLATLLLVYIVTAVLGALDGSARAFSVAGVLWLMAISPRLPGAIRNTISAIPTS
jgi:hypothetical protein